MNTFFISPLIPLKFYILIQKEYKNITLTSTEKKFLNNLNKLFDYSSILSEDDKNTIANIINKIINSKTEYKKLTDKLTFVNQNTFSEITNYNYVYYDLLRLRNYDHVINPFKIDYINMCVGLSDTGPLVDLDTSNFSNLDDSGKITYIQNLIDSKNKNIKTITHKIMAKSLVDSKINTITKILSNKNILYNYLKNENFIPQSETFRITDEDTVIENIIKTFKINQKKTPLKNIKILDIGCGGGLLSEPMCRLGADVTAIDASKKNISVAKIHSKKNNLKINYICTSPEKLKIENKFDVILNMEIVEHVEDVNFFLKSCSKFLKKNGIMFVATLNKTLKSYVFAIIGAEYILRWLPIGTHEWEKFLKPEELTSILKKNDLNLDRIDGMKFDILSDKWNVSSDKSINYIAKFIKN